MFPGPTPGTARARRHCRPAAMSGRGGPTEAGPGAARGWRHSALTRRNAAHWFAMIGSNQPRRVSLFPGVRGKVYLLPGAEALRSGGRAGRSE
eukprot:215127-Hanusia_phi.AAC.2